MQQQVQSKCPYKLTNSQRDQIKIQPACNISITSNMATTPTLVFRGLIMLGLLADNRKGIKAVKSDHTNTQKFTSGYQWVSEYSLNVPLDT